MSIRTRLTIWYSAVLALILLIFCAGVYVSVSLLMFQQVDSRLEQAANTVPALAVGQNPEIVNRQGGRPVLIFPRLDALRASEVYVQVLNPYGRLIGISSNISGTVFFENHLDADAFAKARNLPSDQLYNEFTESSRDGTPPIRVFTQALIDRGNKVVGYMQVATSIESVKSAQRSLLVTLLALGGVGILFSAVIGALLARRALRPVDQLTKTAMAIYRAENLDQRVAVPKTNDEVGRLSQAFNEMLDRLSKLFTAQQRLIADVSHEMRTPLTVIRGNVDLLRAMGCADQESLDALNRESDRMTRLVGDLLLLSQADAGVLTMQFHPVRLNQIVSDVERSGQVLSAGHVNVAVHMEDGLVIQADADRLKQVLLNLVDNAIKHTPDGGQVRIEVTRSYNGFVRVSVSDTGVGIPEKDLPYVFERFYRVDKSRSRANGGSGLGLSIANSIVQAHNGRIVVSSKPGVGTTFDVYLPVQQPQQPQALPSAQTAQMRGNGREHTRENGREKDTDAITTIADT